MTVWVLMTAMPPTIGHRGLVQFASEYAAEIGEGANVLLCTQPDEPFVDERWASLVHIGDNCGANIIHLHKQIEQNPAAGGFWKMWNDLLTERGAQAGDTYVSSEPYGAAIASLMAGRYMPYDPDRLIDPSKATLVRQDPLSQWDRIAPEFRGYMTKTVTVFGAESTGKTTLSKNLAGHLRGDWMFEYARPYLESRVNEITVETMTDIWKGQTALQMVSDHRDPKPFIVRDTDLFSTVGYWEFPHWQETLGTPPSGLIYDAMLLKSDLYLITKSNIPFEKDPLRYGGDVREGSDEYWINVCEQFDLNYKVIQSDNQIDRLYEAAGICQDFFRNDPKVLALRNYDRGGY